MMSEASVRDPIENQSGHIPPTLFVGPPTAANLHECVFRIVPRLAQFANIRELEVKSVQAVTIPFFRDADFFLFFAKDANRNSYRGYVYVQIVPVVVAEGGSLDKATVFGCRLVHACRYSSAFELVDNRWESILRLPYPRDEQTPCSRTPMRGS